MNSLIVPVYNARKTIQRLVDSVPQDWELILVEDGSDEPITPSDRAVYIIQDNQGPGAARNTGLKHATGDYVFFADADDELLYPQKWDDVLNHQVIYSVFGDEINGKIEYKLSRNEGCVYATAYNRKFLLDNEIWFPPHRLMEDISFSTKVYRKATDCAVMKDDTYLRHVTIGSVTASNGYVTRELPDRVRYLSHIWDYLNGDEWIQAAINRSIPCIYWIWNWCEADIWNELKSLQEKTGFIERLTNVEENLALTRSVEKRLTPITPKISFEEFIERIKGNASKV